MKICMLPDVHAEIMHYVKRSNFEVSGLGKIEIETEDDEIILWVTSAMLLPQKNTSVTTTISAEAVGKAEYLLKDVPGDLRFWWHSHVKMATFWSGTDRETYRQLAAEGWFAAAVFNQLGDHRALFAQGRPLPLVLDDLTFEVRRRAAKTEQALWDKNYDANVENVTERWSSGRVLGFGPTDAVDRETVRAIPSGFQSLGPVRSWADKTLEEMSELPEFDIEVAEPSLLNDPYKWIKGAGSARRRRKKKQ